MINAGGGGCGGSRLGGSGGHGCPHSHGDSLSLRLRLGGRLRYDE